MHMIPVHKVRFFFIKYEYIMLKLSISSNVTCFQNTSITTANVPRRERERERERVKT
jgi:hypothetical protein